MDEFQIGDFCYNWHTLRLYKVVYLLPTFVCCVPYEGGVTEFFNPAILLKATPRPQKA